MEYVDDFGRMLDPKEVVKIQQHQLYMPLLLLLFCYKAFRHMSHKFHGKGSGRKKTEKRVKKLQEEFVSYNNILIEQSLGVTSNGALCLESSKCWYWAQHVITSSGEAEVKQSRVFSAQWSSSLANVSKLL